MQSNITFNHSVLGEVSLRPLTLADVKKVAGFLHLKDDYLFCCRVIGQQIIKPEISLANVKNWRHQILIDVAKGFARKEETISPYFHNTDDQSFFADFKHAYESYEQERTGKTVQILALPEAVKNVTEFTNRISRIMKACYEPLNLLTESFNKNFIEPLNLLTESLNKRFADMQLAIESVFPPVQRAITEFMQQQGKILARFAKIWEEFGKAYEVSKEEAICILRRYNWCISPSLPITFIFSGVSAGNRPGNNRGEINQLFFKYFSQDDFRNLKAMVENWKNNPLFSFRMKIIRDASAIFVHSVNTHKNYYTVVIPPLLSQIDAIFSQILAQNNVNIERMNYRNKKTQFSALEVNNFDAELQSLIKEFFLYVLFESTESGRMTRYSFNRHKILHGEYVTYGRKDNVLRAFLILDFLSYF